MRLHVACPAHYTHTGLILFYVASPHRFCGTADWLATHHLEGSECCSFHADNHQGTRKGVRLNLSVCVGYELETYALVHTLEPWPSMRNRIIRIRRNHVDAGSQPFSA